MAAITYTNQFYLDLLPINKLHLDYPITYSNQFYFDLLLINILHLGYLINHSILFYFYLRQSNKLNWGCLTRPSLFYLDLLLINELHLCYEILLIMPVENITLENKLIRMKENSQKEKIIKQKMETLFGYKELSISVKEFKKQITGIMQDNKKISDIEEKYNYKEQNELIEKQNININTEINNLNKLS